MKKVTLFLAAAAIIGVGSAFGTASKAGSGEYVLNAAGTAWQLRSGGTCVGEDNICNYTKIGDATTSEYPDPLQNPANFQPFEDGTYVQ